MAERTARLNTIRGLLRELGVFIPVGARKLIPEVWAYLEDAEVRGMRGLPVCPRVALARRTLSSAAEGRGSRDGRGPRPLQLMVRRRHEVAFVLGSRAPIIFLPVADT